MGNGSIRQSVTSNSFWQKSARLFQFDFLLSWWKVEVICVWVKPVKDLNENNFHSYIQGKFFNVMPSKIGHAFNPTIRWWLIIWQRILYSERIFCWNISLRTVPWNSIILSKMKWYYNICNCVFSYFQQLSNIIRSGVISFVKNSWYSICNCGNLKGFVAQIKRQLLKCLRWCGLKNVRKSETCRR